MTRKFLIFLSALSFIFLFPSFALAETEFVWPVKGKILRSYSENQHRGIDIKADEGSPVVAAASGKVIYARYIEGSSSSLNHTISIQHNSNDLRTTYLQVKELQVNTGDEVRQGQIIAFVAKSCDSTVLESHLHFGVKYGSDDYKNPIDFLPSSVLSEKVEEGMEEQVVFSPEEEPLILAEEVAQSPSEMGEGVYLEEKQSPVNLSAELSQGEKVNENTASFGNNSEILAPVVPDSQTVVVKESISTPVLSPVVTVSAETSISQEGQNNPATKHTQIIPETPSLGMASPENRIIADSNGKDVPANSAVIKRGGQFYWVKARQVEALTERSNPKFKLSDTGQVKLRIKFETKKTDQSKETLIPTSKSAYIPRSYISLLFVLVTSFFFSSYRKSKPAFL